MADENMGMAPPKEGLSKGAIIAIVAIGVIVVLGAGYAIGKYSANKTSEEAVTTETPPVPDEPTTVASTTTSATATATTSATDETADWKTYTNNTFGFSIRYPSNYVATNASSYSKNDGVYINSSSDPSSSGGIVSVEGLYSTLTLDSFIADMSKDNALTEATKTTLAGLAAYEGVVNGIVFSYGIIVKNDSGIIYLVFDTGNVDVLAESKVALTTIQKQILSTFQFTK